MIFAIIGMMMGLGKRSNARLDDLSGMKRTHQLSIVQLLDYMKFKNFEHSACQTGLRMCQKYKSIGTEFFGVLIKY